MRRIASWLRPEEAPPAGGTFLDESVEEAAPLVISESSLAFEPSAAAGGPERGSELTGGGTAFFDVPCDGLSVFGGDFQKLQAALAGLGEMLFLRPDDPGNGPDRF